MHLTKVMNAKITSELSMNQTEKLLFDLQDNYDDKIILASDCWKLKLLDNVLRLSLGQLELLMNIPKLYFYRGN